MHKYLLKYCLAFCCLFCWSAGITQNLSNKGKEFWVGYGHHQFMETGQNNSQEMVLYFSADQAANVTVTIEGTTYVRNYAVAANSVIASQFLPKTSPIDARLISLPCSFVPAGYPCGGEGVFTAKGIHIVSDVPIVAYAHIWGSASSGASMLMPVETWGYTYTTLNSRQNYASNCFSWMYVIAQHDNTLIEVTPTTATRTFKPANVPYTILLNRGEIYQAMAGPEAPAAKPEMSGTKIKSIANANGDCYPIAVFAGSSRTSNPLACGSGGGDNDNQQCIPTQAWGKRYLTAPTSNSVTPSSPMWNAYKIAVKDPATIVKLNGVTLTPLANGTYYFESNTPDYIESDKPIMVAQFMTGGASCQGGGGVGDPEMIYISPIEQGIKKIGFYRNSDQGITVNYLTMIIPTAGITSLLIDGSPAFNYSYPHPKLSGYTVVVKRWNSSKAQATAQSDSAFTAITYGLGSVESYGYNAGTLINNLNGTGEIKNTLDTAAASNPFTCTNTPMRLSILMAYPPTRMVWKLSTLAGSVTPATDVTDNAPVAAGTLLVNGITYYRYSLPANYIFANAGFYDVPVESTHPSIENCNNTEQVKFIVEVKGKPVADFSVNHSGCVLDTIRLSAPAVSTNGFNLGQWTWTFPDATTANMQNPGKLLTTTGTQNVSLRVISKEGCVGDTIKAITLFNKPLSNFATIPTAVCEGGTISLSDSAFFGGSSAINKWYWHFGNGKDTTTVNGNALNITYPAYGTYTIKHVVGVSNACISDTMVKTVRVYAKPFATFTYPAGCLPASGVVQFSSSATTPDNEPVLNHLWDFGDANATPANPNTAATPNPSHFYNTFGSYQITYHVSTANGCTKDTMVNATFNLRPVLAYPVLTAVCESVVGTISVATAGVTNSVPGMGKYMGPGTDSAGNFSPSIAGPGTHTIWYRYATTAGCIDSIAQTILVRAKAKPVFAFPTGSCLPVTGVVNFTNTTTISDGQPLSYLWKFNDTSSTAANPDTSVAINPSHNFGEGNFLIKLSVTTANGCTSDTAVSATFSIKPALAFSALPGGCQSDTAAISVAKASVTNNVKGTGIYSGPGTDAAGNFRASIAGGGTHTIWYKFTTNGGCSDSISQTILVKAKAIPSFTVPTGSCLPVSGLVNFSNTTTIADGQPLSYLWKFNDTSSTAANPDTSVLFNPSHNFGEGQFFIKLRVTTGSGCVSDTTISATFSIRPALSFAALPGRCQSDAAVSVAGAIVTNKVKGTGIYYGPGTDAAGNFSAGIAGAGIHTIWYKFTTAGGCVDSVSSTISVNPKPLAAFTINGNICLNEVATIVDQSTIVSGNVTNRNWNFGDGTILSVANGNSFTKPYTAFNTYTVSLVAISDSGCISDTAKRVIAVHAMPVADFKLPVSVCLPGGLAAFTNLSSVPDNAGLTYNWNFGLPGAGSVALNPTYNYTAAGNYLVTLRATSSFGCFRDTVKMLSSFFDQPLAAFGVNADNLCQGITCVFTDSSTAANSTIQSWRWDFGDGTQSTTSSPSKRFANPGTYNVQLTVTNAAGCVSLVFVKPVVVNLQPVVDAGPSFIVPFNTVIRFSPVVNDSVLVSFLWTPTADFTNPAVLRPSIVATQNKTYTLTATGAGNCIASDTVNVKIFKPIIIPNAFSPNGDGINDTWIIQELPDYTGATVEVFNRYGQVVYTSTGYGTPWDGTTKGKPLPLATYYYIINLKNGFQPISGSVTILK